MITDVDGDTFDRSAPEPNRHDTLSSGPTMAKGTNSVNYITPAANVSALQGGINGQFTIVQSGTLNTPTITYSGQPGSGWGEQKVNLLTIPHGLPYTPGVIAYMFYNNSYYLLPYPIMAPVTGGLSIAVWGTYRVSSDATNFYIDYYVLTNNVTNGSVPGLPVKYFLTQQTAN